MAQCAGTAALLIQCVAVPPRFINYRIADGGFAAPFFLDFGWRGDFLSPSTRISHRTSFAFV
jgi:hypothetical protein